MKTSMDIQMDWQSTLSAMSDTNNALFWISLILLGIFLIQVILFIILGLQGRHIRQFRRRYLKLWSNLGNTQDGDLLHSLLTEQQSLRIQVGELNQELAQLKHELAQLKQGKAEHMTRVGMIRYNAFHEMGNDLSFSIAWINERRDGVVITSIYSRGECNVYAKPLNGGQSPYPLSVEEQEAIQRAASGSKEALDGNQRSSKAPFSRVR